MRFRAIDSGGNELMLESVADVVDALGRGILTGDSMLFDAQILKWSRLGDHDLYAAFVASTDSRDTSSTEGFDGLSSSGGLVTAPSESNSPPASISPWSKSDPPNSSSVAEPYEPVPSFEYQPQTQSESASSGIPQPESGDMGAVPGATADPQNSVGSANRDRATRGGIAWKIGLASVALAILAYGFFLSGNDSDNIAFLVGYYLIHSLITFLVFSAVFLKGRSGGIKVLCFFAIYIAFIAGGMSSVIRLKHEARKLVSSMEETLSRVGSSNGKDSLAQQSGRSDTTPKSGGDFAEIERYFNEVADKSTSQQKDYQLELEAIGWKGILDPARVTEDLTFVESRAILKKAMGIAKKYRSKTDLLLQQMREMIGQLKIDDAIKTNLTQGFDEGMPEATPLIRRIWDLEEKTIAEFGRIIDLLSSRRNLWTVQDGRFLFEDNADLQRFNSYVTNIQNYAAEGKEIEKQRSELMQKKLSKMKDAVK